MKPSGICESSALSSVDKQKTFEENVASLSVFITIY